MMTFELILAVDGAVLDTAVSPDKLDFDAAYPYERWGVVVRHLSSNGLATFTKCVARVDLRGAKDYRKAADRAVRVVRDWLVAHHATNEFERPEYLSDGPAVDISFEPPCCSGQCKCNGKYGHGDSCGCAGGE